jgi:hypothetical protein
MFPRQTREALLTEQPEAYLYPHMVVPQEQFLGTALAILREVSPNNHPPELPKGLELLRDSINRSWMEIPFATPSPV